MSSDSVSTFYVWTTTSGKIKSAEVNANFDLIRGNYLPVNPNTATAGTTGTYDIGSPTYKFKSGYFSATLSCNELNVSTLSGWTYSDPLYSTSSGFSMTADTHPSGVYIVTDTSSDRTVVLPTASVSTNRTYLIKNTSTDKGKVTVDGSGAETIDGLDTIALDHKNCYVSAKCDGISWRIISTNIGMLHKEYVITVTGTNFTDSGSICFPCLALDGTWIAKIEISGVRSVAAATTTLTVSGITFGHATPMAVWSGANAFATCVSGSSYILTDGQTATVLDVGGSVKLASKPTFVE